MCQLRPAPGGPGRGSQVNPRRAPSCSWPPLQRAASSCSSCFTQRTRSPAPRPVLSGPVTGCLRAGHGGAPGWACVGHPILTGSRVAEHVWASQDRGQECLSGCDQHRVLSGANIATVTSNSQTPPCHRDHSENLCTGSSLLPASLPRPWESVGVSPPHWHLGLYVAVKRVVFPQL